MPEDEVADTIRTFRKNHLSELQALAQISGGSLGYGAASPRGAPDAAGGDEAAAGGEAVAPMVAPGAA